MMTTGRRPYIPRRSPRVCRRASTCLALPHMHESRRNGTMKGFHRTLALEVVAGGLAPTSETAATHRVADLGDPVSMDPPSLTESLQLRITAHAFDPVGG